MTGMTGTVGRRVYRNGRLVEILPERRRDGLWHRRGGREGPMAPAIADRPGATVLAVAAVAPHRLARTAHAE